MVCAWNASLLKCPWLALSVELRRSTAAVVVVAGHRTDLLAADRSVDDIALILVAAVA